MSPGTFRTVGTALLVAAAITPPALAGGNTQAHGSIHISRQRVIEGDGQHVQTPAEPTSSASPQTLSSETDAASEAAMRAAVGVARSEQPPTSPPVLLRIDRGFRWGDAGIGAAGATGAILLLVGALMFVRTPRRSTSTSNRPQLGASEQ